MAKHLRSIAEAERGPAGVQMRSVAASEIDDDGLAADGEFRTLPNK